MQSSQSFSIVASAWLTSRIVRSSWQSRRIRSNDLRRKRASPTDRASSMIRMSGCMVIATAKASRPYMPDEYVRIGMSMNSSSSAKSTISSYLAASSARVRPAARPPSTTFWRPVSLRLKPMPSESSVLTRPLTSTRPVVGGRMPPTVRISVDLPAPLAPTTPMTLPCGTSNETFRSASISRITRSRRPRRSSVLRSVGLFSSDVRYVTDTFSTRIRIRSEADSELTLPGDEEQPADDEQHDAPRGAQREVPGRRHDPVVEDVAPGGQQRRDRVDDEQELVAVGHLGREVEDRGGVEPDPQRVVEEVLEVAEVDLAGGHEHREAAGDQREQRHDRDDEEQLRARRRPDGEVDGDE